MGSNTALMICNDGLDAIASDPKAGEKIKRLIDSTYTLSRKPPGLLHGKSAGFGNHCNPMAALPSRHADDGQVVFVGQNTIIDMGYASYPQSNGDNEMFLRTLANQMGYKIALTKKK